MTYRTLCIACIAALMAIGCGDDEDTATPLPTPDTQVFADGSEAFDTAANDTALPDPDVTEDTTPVESDTTDSTPSDTTADVVEEEISSSDAVTPADATPDATLEDVSPEDVPSEEDITATDTTSTAVSFGQVYAEVFAANSCSSGYCHGAGAGGFGISDETGTHFALVNQNALTPACGLTKLVVPGDPESSLLWRRIRPIALDEGDVCAPKMPQGSEGVDEQASQLVYDWIAGGALP